MACVWRGGSRVAVAGPLACEQQASLNARLHGAEAVGGDEEGLANAEIIDAKHDDEQYFSAARASASSADHARLVAYGARGNGNDGSACRNAAENAGHRKSKHHDIGVD